MAYVGDKQNAKQRNLFSVPESPGAINKTIYGLTLLGAITLVLILILHKTLWSQNLSKADFYFLLTIGFLVPLLIISTLHKKLIQRLRSLLQQDFPADMAIYLPMAARSGNAEIIRCARRLWWTALPFAHIGGFCLAWMISLFVYFM